MIDRFGCLFFEVVAVLLNEQLQLLAALSALRSFMHSTGCGCHG